MVSSVLKQLNQKVKLDKQTTRQKRTRNTSILSPRGTERGDEVIPWKTERTTFSSRDEIWKFEGCITSAEGVNLSGEQNTRGARMDDV